MVSLTHLLFLATTALALAIKRDANAILTDLQAINQAYNNLTAADNQFGIDGNPFPVQTAVDQIEIANVLAISDSGLSGPLSDSDIQSIVAYVNNTLEPSIATEIQAAEAQKARADAAAISIAIAIEMQELKSFSDAIGRNIAAKAPTKTSASSVNKAFGRIDDIYNAGIAFFSS